MVANPVGSGWVDVVEQVHEFREAVDQTGAVGKCRFVVGEAVAELAYLIDELVDVATVGLG